MLALEKLAAELRNREESGIRDPSAITQFSFMQGWDLNAEVIRIQDEQINRMRDVNNE